MSGNGLAGGIKMIFAGRKGLGGIVFLLSAVVFFAVLANAGGEAKEEGCPRFLGGHKTGVIESPMIDEASGIAASRVNPGVFWVHNDDGPARVYAMTAKGAHLGIYNLLGASMYDWEDIAVGPGPDPNKSYLYVGAIGDNTDRRNGITVYRVPEPVVEPNKTGVTVKVGGVEKIELVYPDGPRNAETLMVDPLTKDIYIVSKEKPSKVYRAAYPQSTNSKTTLEHVATLGWGPAVAGDISPDGELILIRAYFAASMWRRPKEGPMWKAFEGTECRVPIIFESQGEAICFDAFGTGYYTTSENKHQPIYYFEKEKIEKK